MPKGIKGFQKGYKQSEEHKRKIGNANKGKNHKGNWSKKAVETRKKNGSYISFFKGKKLSEEHKNKISKSTEGRIISKEQRKKISEKMKGKKQSPETIEKRISKIRGDKCHFWKGGITPINEQIRQSFEYSLWHKVVLIRDNFTCQKYGIRGGKLVAHHINNFADFPELRMAIDNGITLSDKAHREFHKIYGRTNNTKEQLNEFLINLNQ